MSERAEILLDLDTKEVEKLRKQVKLAGVTGTMLPMGRLATIGVKSVLRNFHVGGRPNKWAPLKWRNGQPLQLTGKMKQTVHPEILGTDNFRIISRHPHAKYHQWGTGLEGPYGRAYQVVPKPGGKQALSWVDGSGQRYYAKRVMNPGVPARPFMLWQKQDADEMAKLIADTISKRLSKVIR